MEIITLLENSPHKKLFSDHGLSFLIKTKKHNILFDLGPDNKFLLNMKILKEKIKDIDIVIISHGHFDHGGGLKTFLENNKKANIYINENAFSDFYSVNNGKKRKIGLDISLKKHPQIILLKSNHQIDDELFIFQNEINVPYKSSANKVLYNKNKKDNFNHEQNLLINENSNVIFMGCGHNGVENIVKTSFKFQKDVKYCFGGFHTFSPSENKINPINEINLIKNFLKENKQIKFFTCHCTNEKVIELLKECNNVHKISTGDIINIK